MIDKVDWVEKVKGSWRVGELIGLIKLIGIKWDKL
jgi:hypothetical protein